MKIAQIAPPWIRIPPKTYGGTEAIISYLIEEQVAQGHEVTLFAPADAHTSAQLVSFVPQALLEAGVGWHEHLKAYAHLHKAVQRCEEFDLVHTHLSSPADMYLFPLLASLATPHVTTIHHNFPFAGDADELFLEWMVPAPIVTLSERARTNLPYALNCVGVVHLGVPMDRFHFSQKRPNNFFTWLGRFFPEKGPHLAIEVAKRAQVPIVLAGTIDTYVQESVDYFEQVIQPLIDDEAVKYIGPVNFQQKIELLSSARGFLNPVLIEEAGATVVIEAMALGCPVISFPSGAIPELVVHGKAGFLVHDLDEMIQGILTVDEIDRDEVRFHAEQHFSARAMVEKYMRIYRLLTFREEKLRKENQQ